MIAVKGKSTNGDSVTVHFQNCYWINGQLHHMSPTRSERVVDPRFGKFDENGMFSEGNPVLDGVIQFDRKTAKGWWVTVLHEPFRDVSFFIGSRAKLLELFDQQGVSIPVPTLDANGDKW